MKNSKAAQNRLCCVCGKYCDVDEVYFPEFVSCLACYQLQDWIKMRSRPYFIVPVGAYSSLLKED